VGLVQDIDIEMYGDVVVASEVGNVHKWWYSGNRLGMQVPATPAEVSMRTESGIAIVYQYPGRAESCCTTCCSR
jgi:hypothetical protein